MSKQTTTTTQKSPAKSASRAAGSASPASSVPPPARSAGRPAARSAGSRSSRVETPLAPLDLVKPLIRVRQIREFTSQRITKAELLAITEVARWSGSSRNEQPCRFIALRDPETIGRIAELGLPQTRGLPTATAAVAIVVPDEPEREVSRSFDDGRAAERVLIAANLLGLGGGISRLRPDVREPIGKLLGLPAKRSVRTIVALGHPTADALRLKAKPGTARLPREDVIFEEHWPQR
jgi:nitroreductase